MSNAMSSSQRATIALGSIGAIITVLSVAAWNRLPVADDPAYFNFADQRSFYGLPHFYDVVSNLFFIYIGFFGFIFALRRRHTIERRLLEPFLVFNLAVFLTGWGSSYFHLFARPADLFWDRLPMAIAFGSLLTLILADRVVFYYTRVILLASTMLGFWSVWNIDHGSGDIRTYILVQFGSLISIVLILLFFKRGHLPTPYLWLAMLCYILAKVFEIKDHEVLALLDGRVSGHTIKHLWAAMGILLLNLGVFANRRHARRSP